MDTVDVETRQGLGRAIGGSKIMPPPAGYWLDKLLAENKQIDANILDLCAAPGGKTMQLASRGHYLTALDISASRLDRLKANLTRTLLTAEIIQADVMENTIPYLKEKTFDAVLLDAPCSATGTIRRHPDISLHRRDKDVLKLTEIQKYAQPRRQMGQSQWVSGLYDLLTRPARGGRTTNRILNNIKL